MTDAAHYATERRRAEIVGIARRAIQAGALQKVEELADLLDLVAHVDPAVIVEIGSDAGGTLLAWSLIAPDAAVYAIDLHAGPYSTRRPLTLHGATLLEADSHHLSTLQRLEDHLAGRAVDVLLIDGDHTYEGVTQDLEMYGPLVRRGGLIIFHDICKHPQPDVGVDRLWAELEGVKIEYVSEPEDWGGIGVLSAGSGLRP